MYYWEDTNNGVVKMGGIFILIIIMKSHKHWRGQCGGYSYAGHVLLRSHKQWRGQGGWHFYTDNTTGDTHITTWSIFPHALLGSHGLWV